MGLKNGEKRLDCYWEAWVGKKSRLSVKDFLHLQMIDIYHRALKCQKQAKQGYYWVAWGREKKKTLANERLPSP
jgi:hypothetical protein